MGGKNLFMVIKATCNNISVISWQLENEDKKNVITFYKQNPLAPLIWCFKLLKMWHQKHIIYVFFSSATIFFLQILNTERYEFKSRYKKIHLMHRQKKDHQLYSHSRVVSRRNHRDCAKCSFILKIHPIL